MPELTKQQIGKLQSVMTERYAQLRSEIREELLRSDQARELAADANDDGDRSVADLISDMDNTLISRQIREIRDIEAAQRLIEEGTYGKCLECGANIGFERMLAYPTAKRCVSCQSQFERIYAHDGQPTL